MSKTITTCAGRKVVLSGGPHTGKTTLMNGLKQELPDAYFVPEPAELIIAEELDRQRQTPGYTGVFPTTRYSEFVHRVIMKSVELEAGIPDHTSLSILDRSLIDNIGYARLNGMDRLIPGIQRHVESAGYTAALFCEPVGIYTRTDVRHEDAALAADMHEHLRTAYEESGIPVVTLPAVDISTRLALAMSAIENF